MSDFGLAGKAALITGGTAGIEYALDDLLARDALNRPLVEFDILPTLTVAGGIGSQIIDFDLPGFSIDLDDELVPSIGDGDDSGVDDPDRQEV